MESVTEVKSQTPHMLWGQDENTVFLTIKVDTPNDVKLEFSSNSLVFNSNTNKGFFSLNMNLFKDIDAEKCSYVTKVQSIECSLTKVDSELWNTLTKNKQYKYYIKVNWDKWTEINDEDDSEPGMGGMEGMDMSQLMSQMGGNMDLSSMMEGMNMPDMGNMNMPNMEGVNMPDMEGVNMPDCCEDGNNDCCASPGEDDLESVNVESLTENEDTPMTEELNSQELNNNL